MTTLRAKAVRLASTFPSGSAERKALLDVLASTPHQQPFDEAITALANRHLGSRGNGWFRANRSDKTMALVVRTEEDRTWPKRGDGTYTEIPRLLHMKGVPPTLQTFLKALDRMLTEYISENIRINDGMDIPDYEVISVGWTNTVTQEPEEWAISLYSDYQKPLERQLLGR